VDPHFASGPALIMKSSPDMDSPAPDLFVRAHPRPLFNANWYKAHINYTGCNSHSLPVKTTEKSWSKLNKIIGDSRQERSSTRSAFRQIRPTPDEITASPVEIVDARSCELLF